MIGVLLDSAKQRAAYAEGQRAFDEGIELLMNPYASPEGGPNEFNAWSAGWVYGWQLKQEKEKE